MEDGRLAGLGIWLDAGTRKESCAQEAKAGSKDVRNMERRMVTIVAIECGELKDV